MKKIGIFYGSSTGTTSELAQKIAKAVGAEANCFDVANASAEDAASFDVLLLGSSTWGIGDLQDDWESFLPELASQNLSGKAVALFGCGDAESYSDTFCGGMKEIYDAAQGANILPGVSTDGYTFDDSDAVVDGKFIGLPLDDVNEDDKTEGRIDAWLDSIKGSL